MVHIWGFRVKRIFVNQVLREGFKVFVHFRVLKMGMVAIHFFNVFVVVVVGGC